MQDKLQEIRGALFALGYPETEPVELIMLDGDRGKVICSGQIIGIYDFIKHTFID